MIRLVDEILRREHLKGEKTKIIKESEDNFIYQVDERYLVRVRGGKRSYERLKFKADLLYQIQDKIPVARVTALGRYGTVTYLIQKFVKGKPLYAVWKNLESNEKEKLIQDLIGFIKELHRMKASNFGLPYNPKLQFSSWRQLCEDVFNTTLEQVIKLRQEMPWPILNIIIDYFDKNKKLLEDKEASILHGDFWPGNILVEKNHISAIIDFEFVLYGRPDYDFFLTRQFCLFPNDAIGGAVWYPPEDFRDLWQLFKKYYPEIFSLADVGARLNLYSIIHNLGLYRVHLERTERKVFSHFSVDPLLKILIFLFDREAQLYFK